jgi:hypothetical protein
VANFSGRREGEGIMPDITMCVNNDCPYKDTCHRFTAVPDKFWQSYQSFRCEKGICPAYIEDRKKRQSVK